VLVDDDEAQRRILEAFEQACTAWRRARKRSPSEAVADRKVQASVRRAGASLGKAAKRMQREQKPPHRPRKVLVGVLVLAGLGGVLAGASKWLQSTPSVGAP
jgi:ferric-dicitrate binding protein FerR (iron transport regulator)